uniref:BED-type domain-containing protein n=1 Tax=Meloidogyne incognita TaxID=6306 RepID=A0A914NWR7_MELIC
MGKTSDIWKYFSKSNSENSAKCLICDKNLACNKGSTKGLWDHFKSMHEKEYCQFMNQEEVALKNQSICKFIESDSQDDADVQIAKIELVSSFNLENSLNTIPRILKILYAIRASIVKKLVNL